MFDMLRKLPVKTPRCPDRKRETLVHGECIVYGKRTMVRS